MTFKQYLIASGKQNVDQTIMDHLRKCFKKPPHNGFRVFHSSPAVCEIVTRDRILCISCDDIFEYANGHSNPITEENLIQAIYQASEKGDIIAIDKLLPKELKMVFGE
jgi:hypothetical protein